MPNPKRIIGFALEKASRNECPIEGGANSNRERYVLRILTFGECTKLLE